LGFTEARPPAANTANVNCAETDCPFAILLVLLNKPQLELNSFSTFAFTAASIVMSGAFARRELWPHKAARGV
jgi:hypothetical protein